MGRRWGCRLMWVQDFRTEPRAIVAWLWHLGHIIFFLLWDPEGWFSPAPALTLGQCWTLLAVWGTFLSFKVVEQRPLSFTSCPISCVELYKDSAQTPGRRSQRPVWLPSLVLRHRALPSRWNTPQYAYIFTKVRNVTQLQGLGCALAQVRHPSQSSFHPAHHDVGVNIKGSRGFPLS